MKIRTHDIDYESSCCYLKILVRKVTLPSIRRVPEDLLTPSMCAAPGSNGESPLRESTAVVQEPQPKSQLLLLPEAIQGLCPAEALSAELRLTFHTPSQQQNEHGEKILAFYSNVMVLDISSHFWGKYRFLFEFWLFTHSIFFDLICNQLFSHDYYRPVCSSLIYGWCLQQRSEMVQISLAFWCPLRLCFSSSIPRKADKLTCWRQWEYYHQFLTWS